MSDARVPAAVLELAHRLAQPRAMRRGWLSVRYLRCNRPGCRCAHRPEARHGPYTSVVRTVGGRTRSRLVPARLAELLGRPVRHNAGRPSAAVIVPRQPATSRSSERQARAVRHCTAERSVSENQARIMRDL